jgi:hypothetical protein
MNRDLNILDVSRSDTSHDPLRRASSTSAHPFSVYLATVLFPHKCHQYGMDGKKTTCRPRMADDVAIMSRSG